MKIFLSKINKHLFYFAMPKIIMDYGSPATLVHAFIVVEQYDHALCQHDAIDFLSLLIKSSKP